MQQISIDIKMTRMITIFLLILLFSAGNLAAEGFELKLKIASAANEPVLLTHYYGSSVFVDDTIRLDGSGAGVLKRDTLLPQGIYKIYLNQETHFDFLLGAGQVLSIEGPDFNVGRLVIEGAKESAEFLAYMNWVKEKQAKRAALEEKRKVAPPEQADALLQDINLLNREVTEYWKAAYEKYPGSFLGAFLMSNYMEEVRPEDIPEEYTRNDSLMWVYHYHFRKSHFFDYVDLTDQRFLYTPILKQKLDTYFERVLLQVYDSVKPAAYAIIDRVESHPAMFRYVVSYLLNTSLASRIMGMDALFVDIARDFYLSGRAVWADQATLDKIRENVIFLENNLMGHPARDFHMETHQGNPFRLYQQNARFLVLAFYEPNCSHCREYLPRLYNEIYLPYRDKGLDVVSVYTMDNREEWSEFLLKHHLTDWHNVWDEHHVTRFKVLYDTRTTPAVYLLDQDKQIIAKKFTIDFLHEFLKFNLK